MSSRDRLSALLLATIIAVSVFAIGGATRWAAAIVAVLVAFAVLVQIPSRRVFGRVPPVMVITGVAAAWTLFQLLPLPRLLASSLTPTLEALRQDGATVAEINVASTISADPPGTLRALTFLITLSGVAFVALRLAISERGRYWIVASVAGTAGATALVVGIHELFGARSLYGVYTPLLASPPVMGPLLNSNHLGCLMALGAICSAALLMYAKQSNVRRMFWAASTLACLVVTIASLSRGAIIALGTGAIVMVALLVAQRFQTADGGRRARKEHLLTRTLPIGVLSICILILAVYVSAGSVMNQFEQTSLNELHHPNSKFAAWRSSLQLVEEAPWVGTGRGAFEPVFTRVHPASALVTFSHVENEPLQAIVEWGLPAAIVIGILCGWVLLFGLRRWDEGPLAAGVIGALMVVAFQSNFDFGIELLGLAVPTTALVAVLTHVPIEESRKRVSRARVFRGLHALLIGGAAIVLLTSATRTLDEDHREMARDHALSTIRTSIENHPLDYLGYAHLAQELIATNDPRGVRVLNHAMRLHPTQPALHRIAARLLLRSGRAAQAETEYAAALRGSRDPRPVLEEIVTLMGPKAALSIPTDADVDMIVTLLQKLSRHDIALDWLDRVLLQTSDLHAAEVLYSLAMERNDLARAERAARLRCSVVRGATCRLTLAKVLVAAKKHRELVVELRDVATWRGHKDAQVEAWYLLCDAHAQLHEPNDAKHCFRRLQGSGLVKPDEVQPRIDALQPSAQKL